ncbi:MAG: RluA family pseudouridine synthase [Bacteroidales bacterium]|jgi:23S rRNA pseudouridine1911/1915/1917 synthase|nr:RluA family pseudouridine synthase [Bacteroidales bacterium]
MILEKDIIFEDNHLLVAIKKTGQLVQGDKTGDVPITELLKAFLKTKYNKPGKVFLGLVHRLDRPVSGLMVFAKTGKALSRLNQQFKENHPEKTYLAIVKNKPPKLNDRLTHQLEKNEKQNKSYVRKKPTSKSKQAILDYELIASIENYHLLSVKLLTGRHHQIRAQLSHIGCPIKGDLKYGFDRSNKDGSISLHAWKLKIEHPVKKENMEFSCTLPETDIWPLFRDQVSGFRV